MKLFVFVCTLVALCVPVYAQDAEAAFRNFCEEWMQKLAAREHDNVASIKWQQDAYGVQGGYIGYTQEHTCLTKAGTASVPVGEIIYREIRYEKHGASIPEAERSVAHPVATTEITEIFRFAGGRWIY
jgi:hypothetical protein